MRRVLASVYASLSFSRVPLTILCPLVGDEEILLLAVLVELFLGLVHVLLRRGEPFLEPAVNVAGGLDLGL